MGLFDKIFGEKKSKPKKDSKLKTPLLDEKFHGLMGLEFVGKLLVNVLVRKLIILLAQNP